jgi:hypothetical protein
LSFNSGLQGVSRTTFRSRATPRVNCNVGSLGRVALAGCTIDGIRRKKEFHALDVSDRCTVAFIHVTATNPLRSRRHSDLVAHPIVADRCSCRVAAVKEIIAGKRRIVTARIPGAVVNGVMPIVIVIGRDSVPPAIVRFERVMRPANAGIRTGNNDVLPGEPQGPYLRCVRIVDPGLDRLRTLGVRRPVFDRAMLRKVVVDERIAFHSRHLRPRCQRFG